MILVTVGTQDKPFTRLLQAVEKQIELGNIKDEVIVQAGCTKYESDKMKIFDYIETEEFNDIFNKADLIITHAGVGTILQGLENNKKMIVAARKKEYGEHVNNHQEQIVENFGDNRYILPLKDFDNLDKVLEEIENFKINKFESNNEVFLNKMEKEIESLLS